MNAESLLLFATLLLAVALAVWAMAERARAERAMLEARMLREHHPKQVVLARSVRPSTPVAVSIFR